MVFPCLCICSDEKEPHTTYWSLVLLRSHPDVNTLEGNIEGDDVLLLSHIPNRLTHILKTIKISIKKVISDNDKQKKMILLDLQYENTPVTNLDYIYYTGDSWTNRFTSC